MRPPLTLAAAIFIGAAAASLAAAAQQSSPPPAPAITEPAKPPAATTAAKKPRSARAKTQRTRHAALTHRVYSPCEIVDGWRAFPSRDARGYFDTRRVCGTH